MMHVRHCEIYPNDQFVSPRVETLPFHVQTLKFRLLNRNRTCIYDKGESVLCKSAKIDAELKSFSKFFANISFFILAKINSNVKE